MILGYSESAGRVRLEGDGPARMHWCKGISDDFYWQLLSEIKIPQRNNPAKREWKEGPYGPPQRMPRLHCLYRLFVPSYALEFEEAILLR